LGEAGFDVVCVPDGMRAIQCVSEETFDLVITDINMPNVSGLAIIPYLNHAKVKLPVIVVTAYEQYRDLYTGGDKGVSGYFLKPVRMEKLVKRIKEVLKA
jgi:DNA-binding response OmpR family regulator